MVEEPNKEIALQRVKELYELVPVIMFDESKPNLKKLAAELTKDLLCALDCD